MSIELYSHIDIGMHSHTSALNMFVHFFFSTFCLFHFFLRKEENNGDLLLLPPLSLLLLDDTDDDEEEMTRFCFNLTKNSCIISQSRINTGGSPTGQSTSIVLPILRGPATCSPLCLYANERKGERETTKV